jgi:hypothetical protein
MGRQSPPCPTSIARLLGAARSAIGAVSRTGRSALARQSYSPRWPARSTPALSLGRAKRNTGISRLLASRDRHNGNKTANSFSGGRIVFPRWHTLHAQIHQPFHMAARSRRHRWSAAHAQPLARAIPAAGEQSTIVRVIVGEATTVRFGVLAPDFSKAGRPRAPGSQVAPPSRERWTPPRSAANRRRYVRI